MGAASATADDGTADRANSRPEAGASWGTTASVDPDKLF